MTVRRMMKLVLVVACLMLPLSWFAKAVSRAREAALSADCVGRLAQLGLALRNYESSYGCFPPAFVVDAEGKPLYSWRVLIAAELSRETGGRFAAMFRFDEPWDSPSNRALESLWPYFACPSRTDRPREAWTSYVAVVGPRTVFSDTGRARLPGEIRDDPSATLMIVETANSSIHWMEPRDLTWDGMSFVLNDPPRPGPSSPHWTGAHRGIHVVTADGRARSLPADTPPEVLKALLTIDGGEPVSPP